MHNHLGRALDTISSSRGVIGACAFDSTGLLESTLPQDWAGRDELLEAASELRIIRDAIDTSDLSVDTIVLEAGNGRAHFRGIDGGRLLLVLFYPQTTFRMVELSVKTALAELLRLESADEHLVPTRPVKLPAPERRAEVKVPKLLRKKLVDCLAPHVGPIARVAYKDAKKRWARDPAMAGDFVKLVEVVAQEIGDPTARREFIEELRRTLAALEL